MGFFEAIMVAYCKEIIIKKYLLLNKLSNLLNQEAYLQQAVESTFCFFPMS